MAVSPYTTANEIENYQGNAALGYGGGAVDYNTNPNDANPLAGIDSTLARIQAEDAQQRALRHQEKRQDQERMMEMLNSVGGSAFNVAHPGTGKDMSMQPISEDDAILQKKADEQRQFILKNPENYGHRPEFYQKKQELDHLSRAAQERAIFRTSEMLAASKEQDPEQRQRIIDNMNSELSKNPVDNFKQLMPHMEAPRATDLLSNKDYRDEKNRQTYGTRIENRNGVDYEVTTSGVPLNEILAPQFNPALLPAAKQNIAVFRNSPMGQNPAYINKMNANLIKNAKNLGIPENEIPWLAVVGQDGKIIYNPNPGQGQAALNLEHYGHVWKDEKVSDSKQKLAEARNRMHNANEATKIAKSQEAREAAKAEQEDAESQYFSLNALEKLQKLKGEMDKLKYEPASNFLQSSGKGNIELIGELVNSGFDVNKSKSAEVPTTETISQILAEPGQNTKTGAVSSNTIRKAKSAHYIIPDGGTISDGVMAIQYSDYVPKFDKTTNKPIAPEEKSKWKIVPFNELPANYVKGFTKNKNLSDKMLNHIGDISKRFSGNTSTSEDAPPAKAEQSRKLSTGEEVVFRDGKWVPRN